MKKRYVSILSLLLALAMLLSACSFGEYQGAVKPSNNQATIPTVTDPSGNVDEDPFTVTLTLDGKPYPPAIPIDVQWNDGYSVHSAPVGADGVARIGGLDGDYKVTISNIPDGYGYDPNAYVATNANRNIEIELQPLVDTRGQGLSLYDAIITDVVGVYCVELNSMESEIFFQFAPYQSGTYTVESWVDTIADNVNPIANYYGANVSFKKLYKTQDDGGAEGSYTKNFKLNVDIADENINSSGGGGAVAFTFGIKATHRTDQYPIKVYIAVKYDGEYKLPKHDVELMAPGETLVEQKDYDSSEYTFVGAEKANGSTGSTMVLDADDFKYWSKDDGGDGYYHVWDPAKYADSAAKNPGYGPILYAKISEACRFMEEPLNYLEYNGNKALTVEDKDGNWKNYKMFIEGYAFLITFDPSPNGRPSYFCTKFCPCREAGNCGSFEVTGEGGACEEGCEMCHPECRHLPKELMGTIGYSDMVNSDGCYGVTEELKEFLQLFSINQSLFMDGDGFAETHPSYPVFATEDDQWLFACGYYEKN